MKTILTVLLPLLMILPASAFGWVTVNPSSLDYGFVRIGFQYSRWFTVQNWGPQPTPIFACSTFGSFWCQLQCPPVLGVGQACAGTVQYFPRFEGNEFQTAQIQTQEGILSVFLRGTGVR